MLRTRRVLAIHGLLLASCPGPGPDPGDATAGAQTDTTSGTGTPTTTEAPASTTSTTSTTTTTTTTTTGAGATAGSETAGTSTETATASMTLETSAGSESTTAAPVACDNDGFVDPDEQCDDGPANVPPGEVDGGYNVCTTECQLKHYCGDGKLQPEFEHCECEDGEKVCGDQAGGGCNNCQHASRYVFVTSVRFTGSMGGLEQAHQLCMDLADVQGSLFEGRLFKAWLSDGCTGPADWLDEADPEGLFPDPVPYRLHDNTKIKDSFTDLVAAVDNGPDAPIDIDETGVKRVDFVWTNVTIKGEPLFQSEFDCINWINASEGQQGVVGFSGPNVKNWTVYAEDWGGAQFCSDEARLYCFEQSKQQEYYAMKKEQEACDP